MSKIYNRRVLPANERLVRAAFAALNPQEPKTEQQKIEKLRELMASEEGRKAMSAIRSEIVNLKVRAKMIGMDFFQTIDLRHDEVPCYEVETDQPLVPVQVISSVGGTSTTLYSDAMSRVMFPLGMIDSGIVKVQRMDLVQGFVDRSDKINDLIAYSILNKLDDMAWIAIAASIAAFDANVWILDAKIKNPPTTNDIDLSSACAGKFTKEAIKGISEHFDRIGKPVGAVYVPAARKHDMFDWVSVSGSDVNALDTVPQSVQEQIWNTGTVTGSLVPPLVFSNVLEGETSGSVYCYAVSNEAPGYFYQKPDFHFTDEKDEGAYHTAQSIVTGSFVIPNYRRMNIARFKLG